MALAVPLPAASALARQEQGMQFGQRRQRQLFTWYQALRRIQSGAWLLDRVQRG
jgi:hypothetical protein